MRVFSKCLILLFILSANLYADVKMPPFFGDNMVLQRDIPLNVWGWADKGEKVTVSFMGQEKTAIAVDDGNPSSSKDSAAARWIVKLDPLKAASTPQTMTVSSSQISKSPNLQFKNVLVGDVWICSGQSNMQMVVSGSTNAKEEIAASENPLIRQMAIGPTISLYPQDDISPSKLGWVVAGPLTTASFTAAGYFFAREIVKETGVPVGLINTSWGGTRIEPWTPAEAFRTIPELKSISEQVDAWIPTTETGKKAFLKYIDDIKIWIPSAELALKEGRMTPSLPSAPGAGNSNTHPTMIFNSMVNPLINYGIKGAIWYQGEANGGEGESYTHKMNALVSGWRSLWKQGDFPFYFVQLANYRTSSLDNPAGGDIWTKTREAQLKTMSVVPNTGMAVIIDIGEAVDIHPKNKQDVGKRLAAWALAKDYGKKIVYSGPLYKESKVEGNKIRISLDHVGGGLVAAKKEGISPIKETPDQKLKWVAIAGEDKTWYWADAVIDGNTILVSSEKVQKPVAVRYAYAMNPEGANLYNKEGFPASPFRTDNW
jgi:sialate O-acetylesterase